MEVKSPDNPIDPEETEGAQRVPSSDPLKTYLKEMRAVALLTKEEEIGLVKEIDQYRVTIVPLPLHMLGVINKFVRTSHYLLQEKGREPTAEELSEKMGLSVEKISEIVRTMQEPVSLERPVGSEGDALLEGFIEDSQPTAPHDEIVKNELAGQINETPSTLSPREEKVLRMRFGIGESKSYTLDEVGEYFHLSRERIRQIEAKALRKLRHPKRAKNLKTFSDK